MSTFGTLLYEHLGVSEGITRYAATLPFLQSYTLEKKEGGCTTCLNYSINGKAHKIELILTSPNETFAVPKKPSLVEQNVLPPSCFFIIVKKIISFITFPLRWLYACFNDYRQGKIAEKMAVLDAYLTKFRQGGPSLIDLGKIAIDEYNKKVLSFSAWWPFSNNELLCKHALVRGLFNVYFFNAGDGGKKYLEEAIKLAPNDSLRFQALSGIYFSYKYLHYEGKWDWSTDLKKTAERMVALKEAAFATQSSFATEVASIYKSLISDYCSNTLENYVSFRERLIDLDDKLAKLEHLGPINSPFMEVFFPNELVVLWNLTAHVKLLQDLCFNDENAHFKLCKYGDRESEIKQAGQWLIKGLYLLHGHQKPGEMLDNFKHFWPIKHIQPGNESEKHEKTLLEVNLTTNLKAIDDLLEYSSGEHKKLGKNKVSS